jgi:hypothetical protein
LTYAGPAVVFNIHKGLIRLLTEKGFSSIEKAVGCDLRAQMDVYTPVQAPVSQSGFPNQPNQ